MKERVDPSRTDLKPTRTQEPSIVNLQPGNEAGKPVCRPIGDKPVCRPIEHLFWMVCYAALLWQWSTNTQIAYLSQRTIIEHIAQFLKYTHGIKKMEN